MPRLNFQLADGWLDHVISVVLIIAALVTWFIFGHFQSAVILALLGIWFEQS